MAFSFTRNLWTLREQQLQYNCITPEHERMTDFVGDLCCIVGMGNVGEAVAVRAKVFGMTVRGVK